MHNVDVVNFVTDESIERNMLATLKFKSGLADLVLDGTGDTSNFEDVNAKEVFVKRLKELLAATPAVKPPFAERVRTSKADISRVLSAVGKNGEEILLGVGGASADELKSLAEGDAKAVVISPDMLATLRHLAELGIITFNESGMKCLYDADGAAVQTPADPERERKIKAALACLDNVARPLQMARILHCNGFEDEACEPVWKVAAIMEKALSIRLYGEADDDGESGGQDTDGLSKMLDDARLDTATRTFIELSHTRLNGQEKTLLKQCEDALAAVRRFTGD